MDGEEFYKKLAIDACKHGANGFVVGCTAEHEIKEIREIIGNENLILSPGLGAQGGDPVKALRFGTNSQGERLIVSSSRSINFAYEIMGYSGEKYAKAAGVAAKKKMQELNRIKEKLGY
jgi:orotidine-5'-phosphate decarboxylase